MGLLARYRNRMRREFMSRTNQILTTALVGLFIATTQVQAAEDLLLKTRVEPVDVELFIPKNH